MVSVVGDTSNATADGNTPRSTSGVVIDSIINNRSLGFLDQSDQDLAVHVSDLHVPDELRSDILYRLPLKSLVRFTSVCKSWYSLINSPCFIKTHLRIANSVKTKVFLYSYGVKDQFSVHRDNETFDKLTDFSSPFQKCSIVSSCNGLLCIHVNQYECDSKVYLWNPSIRRIFQIPHPTSSKWATVGFGFVSATNDYKIVNIYNYGQEGSLNLAGVYELSTGSWKGINNSYNFLSENKVVNYSLQCFFNDAIHWPAVGRRFLDSIVTFDVKKDEFGVLQVPPNISIGLTRQVCLFRDSLALMEVVKEQYRDTKCCIWVMNEYGVYDSWTKHFTVDLTFGYFNPPLGFRHNGDALVVRHPRPLYELVSYDPENKKFKDLGISGGYLLDAGYLVQSLVLLDNQSSISI